MDQPKKRPRPDAVALGNRIRHYLAQKGLTQAFVADEIGVRSPQVNKIVSGLNYPKPETVARIAGVLGIPAALLTGDGLPLLGELGAGRPRDAQADPTDVLPVKDLFPADAVAYHVSGRSMEDNHILHGDYVIVRPAADADNGRVVVAWLASLGAVLKRFDRPKQTLFSGVGRNRWTHTMTAGDQIVGVYVGLIRKA